MARPEVARPAAHGCNGSFRIGIASGDFTGSGGGDFRSSFAANPGNVWPLGFMFGQPFSSFTDSQGQPVFRAAIPAGRDGSNLHISDLRLNDANPRKPAGSRLHHLRQSIGSAKMFADVLYSRRELDAQAVSPDLLFVLESNAFSPFDEDVLVGYIVDPSFARYRNHNEGAAATLGIALGCRRLVVNGGVSVALAAYRLSLAEKAG